MTLKPPDTPEQSAEGPSRDSPRLDRRALLQAALAAAVVSHQATPPRAMAETTATPAAPDPAQISLSPSQLPEPSQRFLDTYASLIGNGTPLEDRVRVTLPEIAENGNIVPYKIEIESPMTAEDNIALVHLLSTANPQAHVATFHFSKHSAKAIVSGRMRLARTQEIIALAQTGTGSLLVGRTPVEVTVGGCGND